MFCENINKIKQNYFKIETVTMKKKIKTENEKLDSPADEGNLKKSFNEKNKNKFTSKTRTLKQTQKHF